MKAFLVTTALGFGCLVGAIATGEDRIQGVTGNLVLIEKNTTNANMRDMINVAVGDKIETTWPYSANASYGGRQVESPPPKIVKTRTDSKNVELLEICNVTKGRSGTTSVAAFFEAKAPGKATIDFDINAGATGYVLEAEVVVTANKGPAESPPDKK